MFKPFAFDFTHDAALLRAAGYLHEFVPADWWDDGGPENGPHLRGHPDMDVWTLRAPGASSEHVVVVVDGQVVEACDAPGWFDEDDAEEQQQ